MNYCAEYFVVAFVCFLYSKFVNDSGLNLVDPIYRVLGLDHFCSQCLSLFQIPILLNCNLKRFVVK